MPSPSTPKPTPVSQPVVAGLPCQSCGTNNTAEARFCEACGRVLVDPAADTLPMVPQARVARARAHEPITGPRVARIDSAPMLALVREQLAADYDVSGEVGRGGMAIVYKATERDLHRTVALKVLPPEMAVGTQLIHRFKREARMAGALDHPNIIPIYRVGQTENLLYLAMKYVEGPVLENVIASQGALPIPVVMAILRASAAALACAHDHGIVHRDIKPANIMIDADGRVIMTDFGVARAIESASMTTTGSLIGTPYFMSPEQCAGKVAAPQSDQYSLGVVAFQMLTGAVPFKADTLAAIMHHHFFTPVPDVSAVRDDVPPELTAVLNRLLSKDPERRYTSTQSLVADLEQVPLAPEARADGETMLRTLAQGKTVPTVSTEEMPPLMDTMQIVRTHDAMRRSTERFMRLRRSIPWIVGALAILATAVWLWR